MIILIGLPKSGTSSFQKLFTDLGYTSYHWKKNNKYIGMMIYNNKVNKQPLLNGFLDTDVITQMDVCLSKKCSYWPQIVDYKQIHKENPNSIFILNKRNSKNLLNSFKKWGKLDQRLYNNSPELISDKTDKGLIKFINSFYTDVEKYFLQYPDAKFITYDIDIDKIEKLKKYIDIKNYKQLPKENINLSDTDKKYIEKLKKDIKKYKQLPKETINIADTDIKMFYKILDKTTVYFEYGCGGRTYQASIRKNIKKIYTVDSDIQWLNTIKDKIKHKNITYIFNDMNTSPNNAGYPGNNCTDIQKINYSNQIRQLSKNEQQSINVVFINGRFRVACCFKCYDIINDNCIIVFNDFLNRPKYHIVLDYFKIVQQTTNNRMVILKKKN